MQETRSIIESLVPLARQAAQIILEVYGTDFAVSDKGGNDPVTVADKRVNELICQHLDRQFPGIPVVAEESDEADFAGYPSAPAAFYVDPLDGTREFVARNGQFVVMIGLAIDGRAAGGLVLAPTTGLLWTGVVGHGAFEHASDGSARALDIAGGPTSLAEARLTVSRSRRSAGLNALIERTPPRELLILGSAGIKATAVARDQADAYVQLEGAGCLWDACAPAAIVEAAGGRYTDQRGNPIDFRGALEIDSVVAARAPLHQHLIDGLAPR